MKKTITLVIAALLIGLSGGFIIHALSQNASQQPIAAAQTEQSESAAAPQEPQVSPQNGSEVSPQNGSEISPQGGQKPQEYKITLDTYVRYKAYKTMLLRFDDDLPQAERFEEIEKELNELVEYDGIDSIWLAKLENNLLDRYHYLETKEEKWAFLAERLTYANDIQASNPFSCDIPTLIGIVLSTKFYNELVEPDYEYLRQQYVNGSGTFPSEDAITVFKHARRNKPHTFLSSWAVDIAAYPAYREAIKDLAGDGQDYRAGIVYTEVKDYLEMLHHKYDLLGHKGELDSRQERIEELWKELYPADDE